ncbi:MAG: DUF2784 domain-containing protein [Bacteriovoracaceae bacterium]|nr:DUF2784 domain-containing protein [Bacteriovoracaceae bacterium]
MFIFLDWFFTIFHTLFTIFNLVGWIHPITRKTHLITIALTLFSWIVMGYFYGFGYCFLTDWHYQVLKKLGHQNLPHSYITFLIERISGVKLEDKLVIDTTMWTFGLVVALSIFIQVKVKRKNKKL